MAAGSQFDEPAAAVAPNYPESTFCVVNGSRADSENGAGKSTIMKILYGLYQADSEEIKIDGQTVTVNSPADALKYGIGMIQQHFSLAFLW